MTSAPQLPVRSRRLPSTFSREGQLRRIATMVAAFGGTMALLGLWGWYAEVPRLLRFGPAYAAVQYNSALALLLVAGALASLVSGRSRLSLSLSLVVLAISGTTLVEHIADWSAGIDQLQWHLGVNRQHMEEFAIVRNGAPGRMPSNGALSFSLLSLALTFAASGPMTQRRLLLCATAALGAASAGAIAFAGYLLGIPLQYGWGDASAMAVPGSYALLIVGLGVLAGVVLRARQNAVTPRRVVPLLAATTVAVASVLLWESLLDHDRRNLEIANRHHAKAMAAAIGQAVDERARVVDRMARRRTVLPGSDDGTRRAAAMQIMRDFPGITSISLLDSSGHVTWHATESAATIDLTGAQFERDPGQAAFLADARSRDRAVISAAHTAQGARAPQAAVLIAARTMNKHGVANGFVLVQLETPALLGDVLPDEFAGQYGYILREGENLLGTRGDVASRQARRWVAVVPVAVRGRQWQLSIMPSVQTMNEFSSNLPSAFLLAALVCTIIAGLIVRAAQLAEEQSEKLSRVVAQLAAENEARGLAEQLRDQNAELLRAQSAVFERQNEQLHSTAAELAQQRDALAREQEFGAALVRSTVDGVAAFDRKGGVHAWNPAMASLTGRPLAEVEGSVIGNLLPFLNHGEEVRLLQEALQGRATELTAVRATHALWHDEVWLDLTVTPMRTTDGKVVGGLLIARDVTESQRVAEVILASKDSAEQANRAKSDFLARMSHELRTPLNAVIGFTNVLLRNRHHRLEKDELTYLERIGANGRHLLSLINEVLDLSKIEAGHESVVISQTPITKLVRDTLADLEVRATEAGVHLEIDTPPQSHAQTDGAKLKQVLINLVGNAIKFTPAGGSVTVRVQCGESTGEAERIDVQDTGIGIPAERLDAIFEAFEQADSQTALTYGGTGLGLAISQKLCELMGHDLIVSSAPGQGSTFSIIMRARRSALAA